jgi:hypothetical protein
MDILKEKTQFGSSTFFYALQAKDGIDFLKAAFEGNKIILLFPPVYLLSGLQMRL